MQYRHNETDERNRQRRELIEAYRRLKLNCISRMGRESKCETCPFFMTGFVNKCRAGFPAAWEGDVK